MTSPEALLAYVYGDAHRWVPLGHRPSVAEAEERLVHLCSHGPSSHVFR